jgi:hypothetical protein
MGFNGSSGPMPGATAGQNDAEEIISASARLLVQGRQAEAFKLLAPLRAKDAALPPHFLPALYFNFALCLIAAEDDSAALGEMEKALEALKRLNPSPASTPSRVPLEYTSKWQKLRSAEFSTGAYSQPFEAAYPQRFPREARDEITAVLIDICERCGLDERAKTFCVALTGPEYETYKKQRL